ncbi:MAG: AAA family ATPase [Bacteroidia bacterium]|nr:AAA family ATPase [Bacteroidia bacterium]
MKIKSVHIEEEKAFFKFDIDFCDKHGVPLDLVVITGANGSGKTTLLQCIKDYALGNTSFNDYIIVQTDDGQEVTSDQSGQFFKRTEDGKFAQFWWGDKISFLTHEISNQWIQEVEKSLLKYVDKIIYEENKTSRIAYENIERLSNQLFETLGLEIEFGGVTQERKIYFQNKFPFLRSDGKEIKKRIFIEELSSGEKRLISYAFSLYFLDIKNSVLLIDEPELSLHPNWQNQIIKVYERFARENNNQIILATHSPFIVGSVRKENIRILVREEGIIRAIKPLDGSFGWRTERILLEILGVKYLRTPEVEALFEELYALLRENEFESEAFKNKLKDLEDLIGYEDNHLKLIRLEILRLKKEALKQ